MKKCPVGIFMYVKDGLAKLDFTCPDCGKYFEGVIIGGKNEPTKCECGCELEKVKIFPSE